MLDSNTWNHLAVCANKVVKTFFKNKTTYKLFIYKYVYPFNSVQNKKRWIKLLLNINIWNYLTVC